MQELACGVLRNMTACSAEHQDCVVSRGGVQLILDAMVAHPQAINVQWACCWALFCLSVHNTETQAEVAAYGAVKVTLKTMQVHWAEPRIQEAGCWVLKELAEQIA